MNNITYKGKEYPTRTFIVNNPEFGEPQTITISVYSLQEAMDGKYEENDTDEQGIDDGIYFYVEDEHFNLDGKEIIKNHLDYQQKFIEEITD